MAHIDLNFVDAIKVQFLKPIFEEDFPERGMTAWLTKIVKDTKMGSYKLYFDFTDFEAINAKYFTAEYYDANKNPTMTAIEAGEYHAKYSVYYDLVGMPDGEVFNDTVFIEQIADYLLVKESAQ